MKDRKNTNKPKLTLTERIDKWLFKTAVFLNRIAVFFSSTSRLHNARFARIDELEGLMTTRLDSAACLLLAKGRINHTLAVRPQRTRTELGNLLVVAPTRVGKGLLAVSQLLSWPHSVVVNDIKGDLYTQTAGYRATLGPVFVLDPTGTGNRYDPLAGKETEDELLSSATQLLHKSDEGDGAIFSQRAAVMLTQAFLAARQEGYAPFPTCARASATGLSQRPQGSRPSSPSLRHSF